MSVILDQSGNPAELPGAEDRRATELPQNYDRHSNACGCQICRGAKAGSAPGHLAARVMRALMREWGCDKPSELPMSVALAACAYATGFYIEVGRWSHEAAHALMEAGKQHHRHGKAPEVPIDVVTMREFRALKREEAAVKEELRRAVPRTW